MSTEPGARKVNLEGTMEPNAKLAEAVDKLLNQSELRAAFMASPAETLQSLGVELSAEEKGRIEAARVAEQAKAARATLSGQDASYGALVTPLVNPLSNVVVASGALSAQAAPPAPQAGAYGAFVAPLTSWFPPIVLPTVVGLIGAQRDTPYAGASGAGGFGGFPSPIPAVVPGLAAAPAPLPQPLPQAVVQPFPQALSQPLPIPQPLPQPMLQPLPLPQPAPQPAPLPLPGGGAVAPVITVVPQPIPAFQGYGGYGEQGVPYGGFVASYVSVATSPVVSVGVNSVAVAAQQPQPSGPEAAAYGAYGGIPAVFPAPMNAVIPRPAPNVHLVPRPFPAVQGPPPLPAVQGPQPLPAVQLAPRPFPAVQGPQPLPAVQQMVAPGVRVLPSVHVGPPIPIAVVHAGPQAITGVVRPGEGYGPYAAWGGAYGGFPIPVAFPYSC